VTRGAITLRFRSVPNGYLHPGSPIRWAVEQATGLKTVVLQDRAEFVDLEIHSDAYSPRELARETVRKVKARVRGREAWSHVRNEILNPAPPPRSRARASLWFSGENVRPPASGWDATLSFDRDEFDGTNAYFPLLWQALGAVGQSTHNFVDAPPVLREFLTTRTTSISERSGFACAFIGNPTPIRMHAITALSRVGRVEVFGAATGRPIRDKLTISRNFRYALCFENDLYPGYITEKVPEAWRAGAIPIWWGMDSGGELNRTAMINAAEFPNFRLLADYVGDLDRSVDELDRLSSQPLIHHPPDLTRVFSLIRTALEGAC
jgi:hypothetical protein